MPPTDPIDVEFEEFPRARSPAPVRCRCPCCPVYVDAGAREGMCGPCRARCLPACQAAHATHSASTDALVEAARRDEARAEMERRRRAGAQVGDPLARLGKLVEPEIKRGIGNVIDRLTGAPKRRR